MSDKNLKSAPESEKPKAGVPQEVADDLAQLAAEVDRMRRASTRSWKITAVVFIILLAVIAGYMKFLVYDKFVVEGTDPTILVQMAVGAVDKALGAYGAPELESGQLPKWAADEIKKRAPDIIQGQLKPRLAQLLNQVPEERAKLIAQIKAQAPQWVDENVVKRAQEYIPKLRVMLMNWAGQKLDTLFAEADARLGEVVGEVVSGQTENMKTLTDKDALKAAMVDAFETHLGPYLDDVFRKVEGPLASATKSFEELVNTPNKSPEQKLDIRILQLVEALFSQAGAEQEAPPSPAIGPKGAGSEAAPTLTPEEMQKARKQPPAPQ